jgi:uncharacterized membrane protein
MDGWTVLIALHAIGATFSLAVGAIVMLRRRKGDRAHRRVGRVWMAAMYWTAGSSFGIRALHPGHLSWIHGLSAWTLVSLTVALWAARAHRRRLHRDFVVGSYFGLVGAGVAAMAFPVRLAPQLLVHRPLVFVGVVSVVSLVAVAVARACGLRSRRADDRRTDVRGRRPGVGSTRDDGLGVSGSGREVVGVVLRAQR